MRPFTGRTALIALLPYCPVALYTYMGLGCRLTAGHGALDPRVGVRIPASQPLGWPFGRSGIRQFGDEIRRAGDIGGQREKLGTAKSLNLLLATLFFFFSFFILLFLASRRSSLIHTVMAFLSPWERGLEISVSPSLNGRMAEPLDGQVPHDRQGRLWTRQPRF